MFGREFTCCHCGRTPCPWQGRSCSLRTSKSRAYINRCMWDLGGYVADAGWTDGWMDNYFIAISWRRKEGLFRYAASLAIGQSRQPYADIQLYQENQVGYHHRYLQRKFYFATGRSFGTCGNCKVSSLCPASFFCIFLAYSLCRK